MKLILNAVSVFFLFSMHAFSQAPTWQWVAGAEAGYSAYHYSVAIDNQGNTITVGSYTAPTITFGTTTLTNAGGSDTYVVKYDSEGNVLWAKGSGSIHYETPASVTTDHLGNIYVCGRFAEIITFDGITVNTSESSNVYTLKLDSEGNALWIKTGSYFNGIEALYANEVTIDQEGSVIVTGHFTTSITFDTTVLDAMYATTIFVVKYDTNGDLQWAKAAVGEECGTWAYAVATDIAGNCYVTGETSCASIIFAGETVLNPYPPTGDVLLLKYDSEGNEIWATIAAGYNWEDRAVAVATDPSGNVYLSGYFESTNIKFGTLTLNNASPNITSPIYADIFVVKYDSAGNVLWANKAGSLSGDRPLSMQGDASGNIYVSGEFYSDFLVFGSDTLENKGLQDLFLVKYDGNGNTLWAKRVGGNSGDNVEEIAVDDSGNIAMTGVADNCKFNSIVFPGGLYTAGMDGLPCTTHFEVYPDSLIPHHYWAIVTTPPADTYNWNWGDGTYSTGAFPSHTYASEGFYTICLTTTDTAGCESNYCFSYDVQKMSSEEKLNTIVTIDVVGDIPTAIESTSDLQSFEIFPNPVSGNAFVRWSLSAETFMSIQVYDGLGIERKQLLNGTVEKGESHLLFDSKSLSNGVYLFKIHAGDHIVSKKVLVMN